MLLEARQAGIDSGKQLGSPTGVGLTDGRSPEHAESPCPGGVGTRGFLPTTSGYAITRLYRSYIAELEKCGRVCVGVRGMPGTWQGGTLTAAPVPAGNSTVPSAFPLVIGRPRC